MGFGTQFENHADKSSREKAKAVIVKQAEVGNTSKTTHTEKALER